MNELKEEPIIDKDEVDCPQCGMPVTNVCIDGDNFENECFAKCSKCNWEEV